ncbi:MAG: hypothetical protein ACNI25_15145 [Halarcobacter sp.]
MIRLKVLVVLSSLIFTLCYADKHYEDTHIYKNLDFLNLNKVQYEKVRSVLIEYKKRYHKYYKKRKKKEKKLEELIKQEKFDTEKYEDISEDIFEDAIELEARTLKKLHKILNPKQREMFSHYLKEWQVE